MAMKNIGTGEGAENGAAVKDVVMQVITAMAANAANSNQIPDELKNLAGDPEHAGALQRMRELCDTEMKARGGALLPMNERGSRRGKKGAAKKKE